MEASEVTNDPFAAAAPGAVADDPFADPAPGGEDIAAEVAATPTGDLPVVDREGAPVAPPAPAEGEDPAAGAPAVVNEDETPLAAPVPAQSVEQDAARDAGQSSAVPAQEPPVEPSQAPQAPQEAPQPAAQPAAADGGGMAEAAKPKGEMRHYKCLQQTADKQWTEFALSGELPEGVKVVSIDGEPFFEARNQDHATRICYALLGTPTEGTTVWPVPKGAFKPKRVKPAPPSPERTRLVIS